VTEPAQAAAACAGCGVLAPDGEVPATWTFQVSERGATYLCEGCARQNLRSIEGRLDEAWW
jgi:hypothetical protein